MKHLSDISAEEQELIDQYLHGELSLPEKEAFEQRMLAEEEWNDKVKQVQAVAIGIGEVAVREKLNSYHSHVKSSKATPVKKMPLYYKWAVAAAVVAIVALAGKFIFFNASSGEKLFAEFYKQDPGLPTEMGVSDNYIFDRAMIDYKTGNYKNAISQWKKLAAVHPGNDTLQYFIGNAYIGDEKWQPAIKSLDQVIANPLSVFKSDAYWYKGMALLRLNKNEEAVNNIVLSDHPGKNDLLRKLK